MNIRKNFFMERVLRHWKRLLRIGGVPTPGDV